MFFIVFDDFRIKISLYHILQWFVLLLLKPLIKVNYCSWRSSRWVVVMSSSSRWVIQITCLTEGPKQPFICSDEGEPWFEQNSLIWFPCESIQERSLSVVSSVTIPPLNLKIWRLTSSLTLEKSPLLVNSATILAVTTVVWSITCFHTPARNLLPASNATTPAKGLVIWRCIWKSIKRNSIPNW